MVCVQINLSADNGYYCTSPIYWHSFTEWLKGLNYILVYHTCLNGIFLYMNISLIKSCISDDDSTKEKTWIMQSKICVSSKVSEVKVFKSDHGSDGGDEDEV